MIVIVMGVAGAGKTTVGKLLSEKLGWQFADADDFHSQENIEKMRSGVPLTDRDRAPWLAALRNKLRDWFREDENGVLACSALKKSYRLELMQVPSRLVFLRGDAQLLRERLNERTGHYMKEEMLASQLATLEEPEDALTLDIAKTPEELVAEIRSRFRI